jgi:lipopolysaccharide export system permease protein
MMILKRYVLTRFLQSYLLTIAGFMFIFLLIDFFDHADEFVVKSVPWLEWALYYVYKLPFIFSYMAPQAVLLATVITITSFARNNEFTAMKACGIGVTGITTPILVASLAIGAMILASNEYIMPDATLKVNNIYHRSVQGIKAQAHTARSKLWFRSANGMIWNVDYYDPERSMMKNVSLFLYEGNHLIRERIDAAAVFWNGRQWEFLNGYVRTFLPRGLVSAEYFEKRVFPVSETPDDFKKVRKEPEEMSAREMYHVIQTEAILGNDTDRKRVDFHRKLSYPFISFVMALVGIPLSLRSSRSGGVLFCVAVSLALGLTFSFFYALGISLGHGGTFDPLMAAWGPLLLFASLGVYLILTLDSEKLLPI